MTLFLVVGSSAFDGSGSVTLRDKTDPSYPEDFTIYPKFRDTPAAAWKQLSQIATGGYFSISDAGKLTVWNSANYDVIFSSSALASSFGFSSTTTSGSGGSTTTANSAISAYPFDFIDAEMSKSSEGAGGHGTGANGLQTSRAKIVAIGTRSNASALVSAIEHFGYLSFADSYNGLVPWTMAVSGLNFAGAGSNQAKLSIDGVTRV